MRKAYEQPMAVNEWLTEYFSARAMIVSLFGMRWRCLLPSTNDLDAIGIESKLA